MFISKRVIIISSIVAVLLAGSIGLGLAFAFSQMHQASIQQATATALPGGGSTTPIPSGQRACVIGIVQSISGKSFVVSANQGKRVVTVAVNNQTTYSKHGNQVSSSVADLTVGNRVRITAQGQCNRKEATVVAQNVAILAFLGGLTPTSSPTPTP